jgi:exodeoxyribonuclease V alpha subunit
MTMSYGPMLYRNLVYTAITRAKKKVFLFGDPRALDVSVSNNKETIRNTNLSQFVSDKLRELKTEDVVDG